MAIPHTLRPSFYQQQWPSPPKFTEKDLPDLTGKVYLVTGANTGIGRELSRTLYAKNGTVWMACRSEAKGIEAMNSVRAAAPSSKGKLNLLPLDLSDLGGIKAAANKFLAAESRLDVLFNNAGVMYPKKGSVTAQGYELQLGTNVVGPFLFTKLLSDRMVVTAKSEPKASVRVVWVSSMAAELFSPGNGGGVRQFILDGIKDREYTKEPDEYEKYGISKASDFYLGSEMSKRFKNTGLVSVAVNPGNIQTDLYRGIAHLDGSMKFGVSFFKSMMLYPLENGVASELFAGMSPEVTVEKSGAWIGPFGRFFPMRKDIATGARGKAEGGTGIAEDLWAWCEAQVKDYA